jgi:hypothetical protein
MADGQAIYAVHLSQLVFGGEEIAVVQDFVINQIADILLNLVVKRDNTTRINLEQGEIEGFFHAKPSPVNKKRIWLIRSVVVYTYNIIQENSLDSYNQFLL